jgi:Zn-dependent M28 family amino/carboxypeptidase
MAKGFASTTDMAEKKITFSEIGTDLYAFTAEGDPNSAIIVGAHFDFVNKGKGVVDNWSGASLLPSLYQSIKATPRRHTFIFVGFTDEELGLVGSRYYLRQLSKEEIRKISAMVNLDSLGTGPTKVESDRAEKRLTNALAAVAQTFKLPVSIVNVHQVGLSDSDSFQDKKVPSINIHSVTNITLPILHSAEDQMSAIRITDYYDSYRLIAAYLAYLDETLDVPTVK